MITLSKVPAVCTPQLFLQRERAAVLAEAQTDDLIKEAPKPALDQSGEWQETGGEIQWVSNDNNNDSGRQDDGKKKGKDEEDEELDLNKGATALFVLFVWRGVSISDADNNLRCVFLFLALQHAGKHMEDSIVASYTALLLGCLCQGSPVSARTHTHTVTQSVLLLDQLCTSRPHVTTPPGSEPSHTHLQTLLDTCEYLTYTLISAYGLQT